MTWVRSARASQTGANAAGKKPIRVGDLQSRNALQHLRLADEAGDRLRHHPHRCCGRRPRELPGVSFDGVDAWPSIIAANAAGELRFGVDAAAVRHHPGWSVLRSIKRLLNDAGPTTRWTWPDAPTGWPTCSRAFGSAEKRPAAPFERRASPGERVEAAISVPANASSAQRLLTLDAFVAAGFDVVALLNEPSAAGLEYAHRYRSTITAKREYVLIYDLGGGTFDASLLKMTGHVNEVVVSEGIQRLGGDDFDEAISSSSSGRRTAELPSGTAICCARSAPPARRPSAADAAFPGGPHRVGKLPFSCPIEDVYTVCAPLVDKTIAALPGVLRDPAGDDVAWSEVAGIYVVGGAGSFPLVSRLLRTTFGEKRVKRSSHPFAATAIGLAVFLDTEPVSRFRTLFATFRGFREARAGDDVVFDPIVPKDAALPTDGQPPLSSGGPTGRRTTSDISALWSAVDWSTAVPTAT